MVDADPAQVASQVAARTHPADADLAQVANPATVEASAQPNTATTDSPTESQLQTEALTSDTAQHAVSE